MSTTLTSQHHRLVPAAGEWIGPDVHAEVAAVIGRVAKETNLTPRLLLGHRRAKHIVAARHYAYWLSARETGASLAEIGRAFGDRHGSTIDHGIKQHDLRVRRAT